MAGPSRTLTLAYAANTSRFRKGNQEAESSLGKLGQSFGKFAKVAAVGALAAGTAALALGKKLFDAGEAAATANARIGSIAESMDLFGDEAGTVTSRLVDLANTQAKLTGVSRTTIKETSALLLTFRSVASSADDVGGVFDRAQQAALDLAAAGFGSATSNAQQLGKALEDPIKGLTALTRSGVTFTDAEKERIKVLVESGQVTEAQTLILEAIEKQVGGTAEATANASDKIKESFGVLVDEIALALAPTFEKLTDFTLRLIDRLQELWVIHGPRIIEFVQRAQQRFVDWWRELRERFEPAIRDLIQRVKDFIDTARDWWQRVSPGVTESFRRLRDPIIKLWDGFKDLWNSVKDLFKALGEVFGQFSKGETEGSGFETFIRILVGSVNLFVSALGFVVRAIQTVIDALKKLVESRWFQATIDGLQRIIDLWRRVRGLSEEEPPAVPEPVEAPRGTTPPPLLGGPRGGGGGDAVVLNINTVFGDEAAIAREVERILQNEVGRSGSIVTTRQYA